MNQVIVFDREEIKKSPTIFRSWLISCHDCFDSNFPGIALLSKVPALMGFYPSYFLYLFNDIAGKCYTPIVLGEWGIAQVGPMRKTEKDAINPMLKIISRVIEEDRYSFSSYKEEILLSVEKLLKEKYQ